MDKQGTIEVAAKVAETEPILFGILITIALAAAIYVFWMQVQKISPLKGIVDSLSEEQAEQTKSLVSIKEDVGYMCTEMKEAKEREQSKELMRQVVAETKNTGEDYIRGID